jgi:hypothetical protein
MSKGSAPPPPQESQYSKTLADIANQRWDDYVTRFQPNETAYREAVDKLNSDDAYAGAMAKGLAQAGQQTGAAAQNAALNMAQGGSAAQLMSLGSAGANAAADAAFGGYAAQRANYLNQAQGVAKLGTGQVDGSLGAFKSIADADTSRINSNYAQQVGYNVAKQNANSALLSELSKLGLQYKMSGGKLPFSFGSPYTTTTTTLEPDWDAMGKLPTGITGYTGSNWV